MALNHLLMCEPESLTQEIIHLCPLISTRLNPCVGTPRVETETVVAPEEKLKKAKLSRVRTGCWQRKIGSGGKGETCEKIRNTLAVKGRTNFDAQTERLLWSIRSLILYIEKIVL